ncbi:VCBS repeat-containing protein [Myxococcota bacterium]|nr:VCBS repeat-containing protein [Myxococcota bacterium]
MTVPRRLICALSPLPALLLACKPDAPSTPSALEPIDGAAAVSVQVAGGAGTGTVELPVLLVNAYGAAVAGTEVELAVDTPGYTLESSVLVLDAEGHAVARVRAPEPGAFTVRVVSSGDGAAVGATATGVALGGPAPRLQLDTVYPRPAELGEARAMARGTRGVALVDEQSVWWVDATPGGASWRVLAPPFAIVGVRQAEVDADGVHDLVVWGEQQVVLLRGRAGGGYSWGAGWSSPDMQVVGVSVEDVDGDQLADLVVGQTDEAAARVELLQGDGVWGFQAVSPLELDYPISDLVAADEDADGRPDITVLDAQSGWLRRYTRTDERWTGSSPPQLDRHSFPAGSVLLPPSDLDGDGVKDVIGVSGPGSGAQSVVFYILVQDEKYEQAYAEIQADVFDVDHDGNADLLLMEDGVLHRIRYDAAVQGFVIDNYDELADAGPISASDLTGDGVADLTVLSDGVILHLGESDVSGTWKVGSPSLLELLTGLDGPFELVDLDGDGDRDVVGVISQGGGQALKVWRASWDPVVGVSYSGAGTLELNATGDVQAMVRCDPDWYLLADNAAAGNERPDKAFRIRITADNGYLPAVQTSGGVTGTILTCGYPQGAERRFAVADTAGHVTVYAYDLSIQAEEDLGPIEGLTYADTDGDGKDDLHACASPGCQVIGSDLDGDGRSELVYGGGPVSVEGWDGVFDAGISGMVSVDDMDGDGVLDVLVTDGEGGRISAIPTLAGALGPPVSWFTTETIVGPVRATDYDEDGRSELVFREGNQLVGTQRTETGD